MIRSRRKSTAEKEREKRRKKMLKTKYGRRLVKHSRKGMQSCLMAGMSLTFLVLLIFLSFILKGQVGLIVGFLCLGMSVAAVKGILLAVKGFKERERNYITCKAGIGLNAFLLLLMILIFVRGLL